MFFCISSSLKAQFPQNFFWCTATSAHQIEGDNFHSDWWHFEQEKGTIKNFDRSGKACDHWNKIEEDSKLLTDLGVNMHRFSIAWSKIEPQEKKWNLDAIKHYNDEIKVLLKHKISPMLTLQHFTLPKWLADKGGWESEQAPAAFSRFVKKFLENLDSPIKFWITVNEPMLVLAAGYVSGIMPPAKKNLSLISQPIKNMLKAHAAAYHLIHQHAAKNNYKTKVGVAHHITIYEPYSWFNPLDHLMTNIVDKALNWTFIEAIETGVFKLKFPFFIDVEEKIESLKGSSDFLGLNYYAREHIRFSLEEPYLQREHFAGEHGLSDMNQEIYPSGLGQVLAKLHQKYPHYEIFITENGVADAKDEKRKNFILQHLQQVEKAIQKDIPVRSYCHWSLYDNFEWMEGFSPRFGLYEINYKNQKRTLRKSGLVYKNIIKQGKLDLTN